MKHRSLKTEKVDIVYQGGAILANQFLRAVVRDAYLVIGGFAFICVYVLIYTRSLYFTIVGVGYVFSSLPAGYYLLRTTYGYNFSVLNVLTLWMLLGVGVDDV